MICDGNYPQCLILDLLMVSLPFDDTSAVKNIAMQSVKAF